MKQFIYPYIMYKDTREAVEYYKEVFDAKVNYTMLGKDTPNCPIDQLERVMHLELLINDRLFYMADDDVVDNGRIQLHLDFSNQEFMRESFKRMAKESTVIQELGKTFWGAEFGVIKDKFDVIWQFHFGLPKED